MPRTARNAPGGVCYHLINRSNGRVGLFCSDEDYRYFICALQRTQERHHLELFAACLMPNHVHLVARPQNGRELGRWMQRLLTTHVRWHHGRRGSSGCLWQGRFKAFPIAVDRHLITVLRYVERNALRARLVTKAEQWPWGSLHWRQTGGYRTLLSPPPVELPRHWVDFVNEPQSDEELFALRACVNRGQPYGDEEWVTEQVRQLGLSHTVTGRGRPRSGGNEAPTDRNSRDERGTGTEEQGDLFSPRGMQRQT